jgi:hypothetical protein
MSHDAAAQEQPDLGTLPPKLEHKRLAAQQLLAKDIELLPRSEPAKQEAPRVATSKIRGTAHPNRPRIGQEYQAVIPDLQQR